MIPGTPPCLQKHGAKKSAISEDAAQNLKAEVQGEVKEEAGEAGWRRAAGSCYGFGARG